MDSVASTNRSPLRSAAAAAAHRSSSAFPNRVAASRSGVAPGYGGGQFGKAQGFGAVRITTAGAQSGNAGRSLTEERQRIMADAEVLLNYSSGKAFPLGVSQVGNGLNFAIFSQHASSVTLCIKLPTRETQDAENAEIVEFALDCEKNKTGDIWHVSVEGLPTSGVLYGYRVNGPQGWGQGHRFDSNIILLDPYAKLVSGRNYFGVDNDKPSQPFGTYDFDSSPFDWGVDYQLPNLPETDLVIYEMNVRAFTADESSGLDQAVRGSYLGFIDKLRSCRSLIYWNLELMQWSYFLFLSLMSWSSRDTPIQGTTWSTHGVILQSTFLLP